MMSGRMGNEEEEDRWGELTRGRASIDDEEDEE